MADYVIPPAGKEVILIKCRKCKTMYSPNKENKAWRSQFEECPVCGENYNGWDNVIPMWRYKWIRFWRGIWHHEQPHTGGADD